MELILLKYLKEKNQMTISVDKEKVFAKINNLYMKLKWTFAHK